MGYRVTDAFELEVKPGDHVTDHAGIAAVFHGVERGPAPGRSAKVMVEWLHSHAIRVYYAEVFGLTVEEVA